MRIDFREERKWKIALAFDLSTAVLEWHRAGNEAERKRLGIIVRWHKPREEVDADDEAEEDSPDDAMNIEDSQPNNILGGEYGSDDSDDDQDQDKQDVVDALEPSTAMDEAIEDSQRTQLDAEQTQSQAVDPVRPKEEDVDDPFVLRPVTDTLIGVDLSQRITNPIDSKSQTPDPSSVLRLHSNNPILAAEPAPAPATKAPNSSHKPSSRSNAYAPYRTQIAYSDETALFLNLDDLPPLKKPVSTTSDQLPSEEGPPPPDLASLFPDLQAYSILDVAPDAVVMSSTAETKKKTKVDREDPHKRIEESTLMKLAPLGRFMREKPTLLGPLQPAKHWVHDHWEGLDEGVTPMDFDTPPPKPSDDMSCGMMFAPIHTHVLTLTLIDSR